MPCHPDRVRRNYELAMSVTPREPFWAAVIRLFECEYGYNPDPSRTPGGEFLRWALTKRALSQQRTGDEPV